MSTLRISRSLLVLPLLAIAMILTANVTDSVAQKADKKAAQPTWSVIKVEFKVADRIADPPPPKGVKAAPKEVRKVVDEETTPYISISKTANYKGNSSDFKIVDGLGQAHAGPSTYVFGANGDTMVFKRANWREWGELYLQGPGDQKVALSKFLPAEEQAAWKLKTATILGDANEKDKAIEMCQQILKQFPNAKAAKEAKELIAKLKK